MLLELGCSAELVHHRLLLHLRCAESIEWILTSWAGLISLHTHHAEHLVHLVHLLLLLLHRVRRERHGLEATSCWFVSLRSAAHGSERISTGDRLCWLLRAEWIGLTLALGGSVGGSGLLLSIEAIEEVKLIVSWYLLLRWHGRWLACSSAKDIIEIVVVRISSCGIIARSGIGAEHIKEIILQARRWLCRHLCLRGWSSLWYAEVKQVSCCHASLSLSRGRLGIEVKGVWLTWFLLDLLCLLGSDSGEITCVDHLEETQVLVHLKLLARGILLRSLGRLSLCHAIQSIAVEVHVGDSVRIFSFFHLFVLEIKARFKLSGCLCNLILILLTSRGIITATGSRDNDSQRVDEASLGVVELWQGDREVEDIDQLVCFVLDSFGQIDEVLIHDECFLCICFSQLLETLQDHSDVSVVDSINFHKILEQHKDYVGEKACLFAEVGVLEKIEDLGGKTLEVLVILEDLSNVQLANLLAEAFSWLGHNISLHAGIHVVLDVH